MNFYLGYFAECKETLVKFQSIFSRFVGCLSETGGLLKCMAILLLHDFVAKIQKALWTKGGNHLWNILKANSH